MKLRRVIVPIALIVVVGGLLVGPSTRARAVVKPLLVNGGVAVPAGLATPTYGLFGCQVGLSSHVCYDPYQMRTAYGLDGLIANGFDGRYKTIVIVDAFQSPNIAAQLNYYNTFYGLPGLNGTGNPYDPALGTFTQAAPDGLTPFNQNDPNMLGWAEEISLDVIWAHAIAPGANITLVLAKSNNDDDILSATRYAVEQHVGDVISQSFGEDESCMDPGLLEQQHQVFAEATLRHITLFASSGDEGAAQPSCDGSTYNRAASSPASDPLVTAVGGTELHAAGYCLTQLGCDPSANPAPGTWQGEIAWNEFNSIASGGGFSVLYDEPPYQQDTIHPGKQLGVPDVAYSAAVYHGVLTYLDIPGIPVGMYLFGGTSAGSPQWAAITAIADQRAHTDLGFINSSIYKIGQAQQQYAASLHDITIGNNSVVEQDENNNDVAIQGFEAAPGWDPTTGLGSPAGAPLVDYLIQFNSPGDATSAVATTTPHPSGGHRGPNAMRPHAR
jgi:subtilase family serine protease